MNMSGFSWLTPPPLSYTYVIDMEEEYKESPYMLKLVQVLCGREVYLLCVVKGKMGHACSNVHASLGDRLMFGRMRGLVTSIEKEHTFKVIMVSVHKGMVTLFSTSRHCGSLHWVHPLGTVVNTNTMLQLIVGLVYWGMHGMSIQEQ